MSGEKGPGGADHTARGYSKPPNAANARPRFNVPQEDARRVGPSPISCAACGAESARHPVLLRGRRPRRVCDSCYRGLLERAARRAARAAP